ncbi:family 16 glycosylhydrolase [Pontibacter rugosus]|uniref:Family 16 glycosylhydrolase n=1 Tax=Pontibacter rugosus TaxID=1745966 RepID=A0ABW3SQZ2_9BACT
MHIFYKAILTIAVSLITLCSFGQAGNFNQLVWSDEFEGEGAPNPAYWKYDLGSGGWGNREVQTYTSQTANVRQSGGKLVIEAIKQNGNWTSARVLTQGKYNFTYGRIEFRAKLPKGAGTWPALWMLGESLPTKNWPAAGEIDVMEHVGRDPGKIHATLHTPSSYGNSQNSGTVMVNDYADAFHTYAAEWTKESLKFFVDDKLFYTYAPSTKNSSTWPFDEPFFIIMNIAMGGNFGSDPRFETNGQKNGIDPALNSVRMEVDYVRVYQNFDEVQITGPAIVAPNASNLTFSASKVTGATYTWEVPAGAAITAGAGTSEIKVNWGQTSGSVKVTMQLGGEVYTKDLAVKTTQIPQGESFLIEGFDNDVPSAQLSSSGGTFTFDQENGALRIGYDVTNPSSLPQVLYTLSSPVDMSEYAVLAAKIKTKNESGTVTLRIDLKDPAGNTTGSSKAFTLLPLIDDGEYYTYYFDYSTLLGEGQVNPSQINQIRVLVNYGIYGSPGSDIFHIEEFSVLKDVPTVPNRPSHLSLQTQESGVKVAWQDNASNETGFKVYRASTKAGPFTEVATLAANTSEYIDATTTSDELVYKVQALNNSGASAFTNTVSTTDAPLGIKDKYENEFVKIYPNPVLNRTFRILLPPGLLVQQVQLVDALGRTTTGIQVQRSSSNQLYVQLQANMAPGVYFCRLQTEDAIIMKRILIN